jgi:hypothetical protein
MLRGRVSLVFLRISIAVTPEDEAAQINLMSLFQILDDYSWLPA